MVAENQGRLRILLVEDDNHIGRIIELALPSLGIPYEFAAALSAEEGLELWEAHPFDMLLTDYNLRGMTGLKLVEVLRQHGEHAPMILITAYDSPDVRRHARTAGVDAYVMKPFFVDELIETVRKYLPARAEREVNGR
ncbi:MAG: response regulator [Candidatus Viridilinea halotolerans]|uniref:Response regulator n=1 Tax=Candidatus Viridilinea halotolerans TaxID=2491704 RepID=A0A426TTA4_9CHLR|nr:MAG: response regulator [Candidatus Viridilinea halotolerans]